MSQHVPVCSGFLCTDKLSKGFSEASFNLWFSSSSPESLSRLSRLKTQISEECLIAGWCPEWWMGYWNNNSVSFQSLVQSAWNYHQHDLMPINMSSCWCAQWTFYLLLCHHGGQKHLCWVRILLYNLSFSFIKNTKAESTAWCVYGAWSMFEWLNKM